MTVGNHATGCDGEIGGEKTTAKMPETRVINIRSGEPYDIYIGRGNDPRTGIHSKWGNPYSHQVHSIARFHVNTRGEAIGKYAEYLMDNRELRESIPELKGLILGCWCKPARCHGDVLAALADARRFREVTQEMFRLGYATLGAVPKDGTNPEDPIDVKFHDYRLLFRTIRNTYVVEVPE